MLTVVCFPVAISLLKLSGMYMMPYALFSFSKVLASSMSAQCDCICTSALASISRTNLRLSVELLASTTAVGTSRTTSLV